MADPGSSEYNGASLVATAVTFLALSWISVLLRIYVRAFMTNCFQLDDWFMVIGQVRRALGFRHGPAFLSEGELLVLTATRLSSRYLAPSSCLALVVVSAGTTQPSTKMTR